jgi:hypothetical protein
MTLATGLPGGDPRSISILWGASPILAWNLADEQDQRDLDPVTSDDFVEVEISYTSQSVIGTINGVTSTFNAGTVFTEPPSVVILGNLAAFGQCDLEAVLPVEVE